MAPRGNNAATRDAPTIPGLEEFVSIMEQRGNGVVTRGVPNKPNGKEEFVTGTA